jgi:hypothetical protein
VETSAGEPLISTRPFAVTKCSAWLVSNESSRLSGSKHSYTESTAVLHPTLLSSPYKPAYKNTRVTKPSVPNIVGRRNNVQECQVGSATGGRTVSRHEPLVATQFRKYFCSREGQIAWQLDHIEKFNRKREM